MRSGPTEVGPSGFASRPTASVPVVTEDQMREVDQLAVASGLALIQMMENAGRSLAALTMARFRPGRVRVLAGSGGNGGGAMAAARHLLGRGVIVDVSLTRPPDELTGVPARQWSSLAARGVAPTDPAQADLVIDGVIGYSLAGPPTGRPGDLIDWARGAQARILALDTPSGVDVTTGEAHRTSVTATATLTLALPKVGLVGSPEVGEHYLADLTIGADVYARIGLDVPTDLFAPGQVLRLT